MESPRLDQMSILQRMTSAMKVYKLILHQLESEFRVRCQISNRKADIEGNISELAKLATQIELSRCKQIRLNTRLVNRFIEITTLYRNKLLQCDSTFCLRDHIDSILLLFKEYQLHHHLGAGAALDLVHSSHPSLVGLFDQICLVFKRCARQIKDRCAKTCPGSTHEISPEAIAKEKEKQRRVVAVTDPPLARSLEHKFKKAKQVIETASLFVGMDIDIPHLRGLCMQASNNLDQLQDKKIEANVLALRCRDMLIESFSKWRQRERRKSVRKQKSTNQQLPREKLSNYENKVGQASGSMGKTLGKMPRLYQAQNNNSNCPGDDRKRQHFKQMHALTFNRQFIHLSEIKNQKIAKRPYAEVKQVLVAGDELSYYSNKYYDSAFANYSTNKTNFFMQRATKNENLIIRKKPCIENSRLATEE